jgi:hypothetical protein
MPARVILSTDHGTVSRSGSLIRFAFKGAPLAEVVGAASRIFQTPVICPDGGSREFSGSFSAAAVGDALARIAEFAGWRLGRDGGAWVLEQPGGGRLQEIKGGFAGAKGIP